MFRQIHSSIWAEPWFEPLSSDAKLLYLYLLSSSLTTPSGFLTASPQRISLECGLTLERIPTASAALVDSGRVLYWPELNLYWLKKFSKWQGSLKNEKWLKHVGDSLKGLPDCAITAFISEYPTDTLPIPYPYPTDRWNTTEQNNTTQNRTTQTNKTVTPPSPPSSATPLSFDLWLEKIKSNGNPISPLGDLYEALKGEKADFARLGKLLKSEFKGDAGYLAKCLWQASAMRPAGDFLSYVSAMATSKKGDKTHAKVDIGPWDTGEKEL